MAGETKTGGGPKPEDEKPEPDIIVGIKPQEIDKRILFDILVLRQSLPSVTAIWPDRQDYVYSWDELESTVKQIHSGDFKSYPFKTFVLGLDSTELWGYLALESTSITVGNEKPTHLVIPRTFLSADRDLPQHAMNRIIAAEKDIQERTDSYLLEIGLGIPIENI